MKRKMWWTAGTATALAATLATGGYTWAQTDPPSTPTPIPEPPAQATPSPGEQEPDRDFFHFDFDGPIGIGCGVIGDFELPMPHIFGLSPAQAPRGLMGSSFDLEVEPVGPPMMGMIERAVAPADSSHALRMAYDALLRYHNSAATGNAAANSLFDQAKQLYQVAYDDQAAGRTSEAISNALASQSTARAALQLQDADRGTEVPGLTPPSTQTDDHADERASCALNQAYNLIGEANAVKDRAGPGAAALFDAASDAYTQASNDYNAGNFDQAEKRARAAASAATAVVQLGGATTTPPVPNLPPPPRPSASQSS